MFGLETILIYTALLLKKRIVVYHHSLEALLKWMSTFPALMWHRKAADILFPWVDLVSEEILDLKSSTSYVAGCRDSGAVQFTDLYDVLVNLPAREITVATHAKESMTMTKTHKDIAVFMVQLAENESLSEQHVVREIADKTRELLNQLRSLATVTTPEGKHMVSIETLRERNLPQALDNFLFNLAVAENIMML
uniref:Protein FAM45A-like protein n=1 Tax=Coptotermes formosanus TaxID=36987 RepID=R4V4T6_COPFO|nr:protein FAM45A-like protein [Coptotermes formosanus]